MSRDRRRRLTAATLVVGSLALFAGLVAAHRTSVDGYEVSIYGGTPTLYWVGVAVAIGASVVVAAAAVRSRERRGALLLGGLAVASIAGLPLLRSYRFHGRYDPLTHFGWVKGVDSGALDPFQLLYPAAHSNSVALSAIGGTNLTRAMMLVVWLFAVLYLVFVPLCAHLVADDRRALVIGALSALTLLPINTISTYLHFHPYTLATLYFPFVLYFLLAHLTDRHEDVDLPDSLAATSLALPFASVGIVLVHPQTALNVVIFMGTIAALQLTHHRLTGVPDTNRRVYAQFAVIGLVFGVWVLRFGAAMDLLANIVDSIRSFVGAGSTGSSVIQHQTQSADKYGVSLVVLFAKLFLASAVYSLLAAAMVLYRDASYLSWTAREPDPKGLIRYFGVGAVVLTVFFAGHLVGEVSTYFFRHLGFAMVLATVVGSVGLVHFSRAAEDGLPRLLSRILPARFDRSALRHHVSGLLHVVGVVFVVGIVALSLVAVFPSPFTYQPGQHVTDAQLTGYNAGFDTRVSGAGMAGVGGDPMRFSNGLHERLNNSLAWTLSEREIRNITTYTQHQSFVRSFFYVYLTEADYEREVVAYRGFRYSERRLDSLHDRPAVSRIYDNGGVRLYYVQQPRRVLNASEAV